MSRLKKRIIKEPYAPFMIKLEAAILREGEFPDIKSFVYNYIYKGFTFKSLNKIIEERYGIKTTYDTTLANLRKFAPPAYNVHTRHHFKRRAVAGGKGGEKAASVTYFVNEMIRKGKTTKEIGKKLKINPRNALRDLQKSYPIDFKGKTIFPDMARFGMKRTSYYYKWLKQAKKFGFDSVVDAIEFFLLEKKIPLHEVAFIFNTTSSGVEKRIKKCEYLNKKIKCYSKRRKMAILRIAELMYELTGYQKSNLQFILGKLPECIKVVLEKDGSVQFNGLGTFSIKDKKAKTGRNPKTGETIQIPEKRVVHFKMHKSFRDSFMKK